MARYRGYYGGSAVATEDPIAAAINGFMGGWDVARQRRIEDEELKRRRSIEDQQLKLSTDRAALDRERFDAERNDLEMRRQAERQAAERQSGRVTVAIPDPTGMMPMSSVRLPVPTQAQQAMNQRVALEEAIYNSRQQLQSDQRRQELIGEARGWGIEGAEAMDAGELTARIAQAKEAAATRTFQERERFRTSENIRQSRAVPPRGSTRSTAEPSEVRAARTEARQAETDYNAMLRRKPREGQFVDPLTRLPDEAGYSVAMEDWRADSTEKAGARTDTRRTLNELLGPTVEPGSEEARQEAIKELQQEEAFMREAIAAEPDRRAEILAHYGERVKAINARYGIR